MVSLLLYPELTTPHTLSPLATTRPASTKMASQSHNYPLALQQYMDLQSQREEVCTYLEHLRPSMSNSATSSASTMTSPATSPTRQSSSRRHSRSAERCRSRARGFMLDTIPDEETMYEISTEERRLFDVDEGIKRALTELLNCDAVRSDRAMRVWVQSRLMETEKLLRSGRRRRSSATD
jgi:hypothetical protein